LGLGWEIENEAEANVSPDDKGVKLSDKFEFIGVFANEAEAKAAPA